VNDPLITDDFPRSPTPSADPRAFLVILLALALPLILLLAM